MPVECAEQIRIGEVFVKWLGILSGEEISQRGAQAREFETRVHVLFDHVEGKIVGSGKGPNRQDEKKGGLDGWICEEEQSG